MGRVKFGPDRLADRVVALAAVGLVAVAVVAVGLAACSDEIPTDYTAAHREAFLAACSRPVDDPRLLSDVCGCVYDHIEDEVPFDEFQRIDARLAGIPTETTAVATDTGAAETEVTSTAAGNELPVEVARLVADCFTLEADL